MLGICQLQNPGHCRIPGVPRMRRRVDEVSHSCPPIGGRPLSCHSSDGQVHGRDGQAEQRHIAPDATNPLLGRGSLGADDGIRTRDPHLGKKKVMVLVHMVSSSLLSSLESPRQSIQYAEFAPVSRQPFNALNNDEFRRARRIAWRGRSERSLGTRHRAQIAGSRRVLLTRLRHARACSRHQSLRLRSAGAKARRHATFAPSEPRAHRTARRCVVLGSASVTTLVRNRGRR